MTLSWKKTASLISIVTVLLMIPVVPAQSYSVAQTEVVRDYWPTEGWLNTTPEEQGMDSELLNKMMDQIGEHGMRIDSVLIARNGYLVFEEYPRSFYDSEDRHIIHSCTKSYTSALVGIAIKEGYIESVDSKLVDLLPNRTIANLDERKQAITLEHLLTMTSGLEWDEWTERYQSPLNSLVQAQAASDNVQYILDLPMAYDPGETWVYSSGGSHLLGVIVAEATGTSLLDYAMDKLFGPLGIPSSNIYWPRDKQGLYWGHGGVEMVPSDMAKFGYLYLNNGTWDGEQILPTEWIQQSAATLNSFNDYGGYSYQWWTYPTDIANVYSAQGYAGQWIFVIPSLDMVVVFTSNFPPYEPYPHPSILFEYIIPAAMTEIPQKVIATNTIVLMTLVIIPLPIIFAGSYYGHWIRNRFRDSVKMQESM